MSKGGEWGWTHPAIRAAAATGAVAAAALVWIEKRCAHPALDLRLFADRRFTASILAAWLCYVCAASVAFLMPFRFLLGAGWEPARAGLWMMAVPAGMLALTGVGAGLFTAPNNSAIMGAAPRDRHGVAGAMLAAARTTGFAAGVALAGLIYVAGAGHAPAAAPVAVARAVARGCGRRPRRPCWAPSSASSAAGPPTAPEADAKKAPRPTPGRGSNGGST